MSLLWEVIEESKAGKSYCDPREQYANLERILSRFDVDTVHGIEDEWRSVGNRLFATKEFRSLHLVNGGFLNENDDGFYVDFGNWLLAQGEDLVTALKSEGRDVVIDYIDRHGVSESDYLFESMIYVFLDYR